MRTRSTLIVLLVAGSALGACGKRPEPSPDNQQVETPRPIPEAPPPAPEPLAKPAPEPATPKPKAAPKLTADEQVLDDADATGMTSHESTDTDTNAQTDASGAAGNSQP